MVTLFLARLTLELYELWINRQTCSFTVGLGSEDAKNVSPFVVSLKAGYNLMTKKWVNDDDMFDIPFKEFIDKILG